MRNRSKKRATYRIWDHLHFDWKPCKNKKDWTQEAVDQRYIKYGIHGLISVAGVIRESKKSSLWHDIQNAFDDDAYFRLNRKQHRPLLLDAKIEKCNYSTEISVSREAVSQGLHPKGRFIQILSNMPNVNAIKFFDQHLPKYRIVFYCNTKEALMYCNLELKHRLGKFKFLHNESPYYREISPSTKFAVPRIIGQDEEKIKRLEALNGIDYVKFDRKRFIFCIGGTTPDAVDRVKRMLRAQMWIKSSGHSYRQVVKKNSSEVSKNPNIKFYPYSFPSFKEKNKLRFVDGNFGEKSEEGQKNGQAQDIGAKSKTKSKKKKNVGQNAEKNAKKKAKKNAKKKKNAGNVAPPQLITPAQYPTQQRMTLPTMQRSQGMGQQQYAVMPQPGGIVDGHIMHMTQHQQIRPVITAGWPWMDQMMNYPRPIQAQGYCHQHYPRNCIYGPVVQQIPSCYVSPRGYISGQVLQTSSPPDMNPPCAPK